MLGKFCGLKMNCDRERNHSHSLPSPAPPVSLGDCHHLWLSPLKHCFALQDFSSKGGKAVSPSSVLLAYLPFSLSLLFLEQRILYIPLRLISQVHMESKSPLGINKSPKPPSPEPLLSQKSITRLLTSPKDQS